MQRLSSPHVPRIYDTGTFGDSIPFIAFELLEGSDLASRLSRGPIGVGAAATIAIEACDAIAEAHALGVVHRDLKPANLMLTATGVKVLDFGIARAPGDDPLTISSDLLGSPAYMPPERMRPSRIVDARSDLWSLGVVLFEAVSGGRPFESAAFPDLCLKILLDDVPPLGAPAEFVAIVRRCLEKEPGDRYPDRDRARRCAAPFATTLAPASPRRAAQWSLRLAAALLAFAPAAVPPRHASSAIVSAPTIAAAADRGLIAQRHAPRRQRARSAEHRSAAPRARTEGRVVGEERRDRRVTAACREPHGGGRRDHRSGVSGDAARSRLA